MFNNLSFFQLYNTFFNYIYALCKMYLLQYIHIIITFNLIPFQFATLRINIKLPIFTYHNFKSLKNHRLPIVCLSPLKG